MKHEAGKRIPTYNAFVELDRQMVNRLPEMFQEDVRAPIPYRYSSSAESIQRMNGNE
jgi:hypothetical protein